MSDERSPRLLDEGAVPLAEKVEFLRRPAAHCDGPLAVETIETHFAYVFLSERFVYKLKKPIKHGEVDYSNAAARRASCELEVALNRRLAPSVYLDVAALTRGPTGLELNGEGEPCERLVMMRRLPRGRTLEALVRSGDVRSASLEALVEVLARFYRRAAVPPWTPAGYRARLERDAADTARRLSEPGLGLDGESVAAALDAQRRFVRTEAAILDGRLHDGRIVDAHGDLRPEHVFLDGEPLIIDCLEFSQALRWLDSAEEITFLALECERLGAPAVGGRLLDLYREIAADPVPPELLAFYRSRRALNRALLAAWRSGDPEADVRRKWRDRTAWYLDAAARSLEHFRPRTAGP